MKVFGTSHYWEGSDQYRAVVATKTKKRAAEFFNVSMYTFNNYACVTKNKEEVELALAQPETLIKMRKGG
jgi:hypothetical protein